MCGMTVFGIYALFSGRMYCLSCNSKNIYETNAITVDNGGVHGELATSSESAHVPHIRSLVITVVIQVT